MSINKTSQSLDHQLGNRIAALEQQMKDIKVRQPIGGGNLSVVAIPGLGSPLVGSFPFTAGQVGTINVQAVPVGNTLTTWNFLHTVRIDVDDANHDFSGGSSLTSAQRLLRKYSWIDYDLSSDTTNARNYCIRLENYDTSPHTYIVRVMAYIPNLTGTVS